MRYLLTLLFCASAFGADIGELRSRDSGLVGRWLVPGFFTQARVYDIGRPGRHLATEGTVAMATRHNVSALAVRGAGSALTNPFVVTAGAISVWFSPSGTVNSNTASAILVCLNAGANNGGVGIGNNTGLLTGEAITVLQASSNRRTAVIGATIGTGWNHLLFAWDAALSRYRIFLNGIEQSVSASAEGHAQIFTTSLLVIGRQYTDGLFAFNGWLGEVRIYNRSLSADEIAALYQEGLR